SSGGYRQTTTPERWPPRGVMSPRNALARSCVSRWTSAVTGSERRHAVKRESADRAGSRLRFSGMKDDFALLLPGLIGLGGLPRGHAVALGGHDVLDHRARIAVERFVEQALDVGVGGRRLMAQALEDPGHG